MTTSRITGVDELRAAFLSFPKALATKELGAALAKGAAPIRAAAESMAPRKTGNLAANIIIAKDQRPYISGMDARYVVFVRWKGKDAPVYWRYSEFGTSNEAPKPYMRPAFATQQGVALTNIVQALSDAVPRIAATLTK